MLNPERYSGFLCIAHSRNNFTKSPPSGAVNASEPRLLSQVGTVRELSAGRSVCLCKPSGGDVSIGLINVAAAIMFSGQEDLKNRAEGCSAK